MCIFDWFCCLLVYFLLFILLQNFVLEVYLINILLVWLKKMSEEKASFEIAENHLRYFLQSAVENDYFAFHEKRPVVGGGKNKLLYTELD